MKDFLTAAEVAQELSVSKAFVLSEYRKGRLVGHKLSWKVLRFSGEEVKRWAKGEKPYQVSATGLEKAKELLEGVTINPADFIAPKPVEPKKVVMTQGVGVPTQLPVVTTHPTPLSPQVLRSGMPGEFHFGAGSTPQT